MIYKIKNIIIFRFLSKKIPKNLVLTIIIVLNQSQPQMTIKIDCHFHTAPSFKY